MAPAGPWRADLDAEYVVAVLLLLLMITMIIITYIYIYIYTHVYTYTGRGDPVARGPRRKAPRGAAELRRGGAGEGQRRSTVDYIVLYHIILCYSTLCDVIVYYTIH